MHEADTGTLVTPTKTTVGEFVQHWLDTATGRSPKTLERYKEIARGQIVPRLGAIALQTLQPGHIRQWHSDLTAGGLSPRTVSHAHKLLKLVLGTAVKDGALPRNVATVHAAPRVKQQEVEIIPADAIATVMAALQGHSLYPIVALAIGTGMRRGELLGLQWGDIELDSGSLQVRRSLEEMSAGLRLKEPKTDSGRRTLTLHSDTVVMQRAHKVETLQYRLAIGLGRMTDTTPVFGDANGELIKPHTLSRAWRRVVSQLKLPAVSFHALRHTHASILISKGVDILTISRRLGHSKASLTLDVYGHLIGGADAAAAAAMSGLLK